MKCLLLVIPHPGDPFIKQYILTHITEISIFPTRDEVKNTWSIAFTLNTSLCMIVEHGGHFIAEY
jgi:hypothetical protein